MLVPIEANEIKAIPNEFAAIEALRTVIAAPGVYVYPGMEGVNQKDPAAMTAYQERTKDLPHGLVVLSNSPSNISPKKLGFQFLGDLLAATVAAVLLGIASIRSYLARVLFVAILGLFAGFLIDFPFWNWYGFTAAYAFSDTLDHVLRSFSGGLVLAVFIKPGR
jgi:hypothetical protein